MSSWRLIKETPTLATETRRDILWTARYGPNIRTEEVADMPRFEPMFTAPCSMPNGLQATDEGIWMVDQETDHILLVDGDGRTVRRLKTETENGSGIAYGDGALWLGSNGPATFREKRPTDREGKYILKIDPHSGASLAAYPLEGPGGVHGVEWAEGMLWVTRPGVKVIEQYDLSDFSIVHKIPSPLPRSHGLAWMDGTLWCVYTADRVIVKQDPTDGKVLERIEVSEPNPEPHGLTLWQGQLIYCDATSHQKGQVWRAVP